jgi:hypothetical protein
MKHFMPFYSLRQPGAWKSDHDLSHHIERPSFPLPEDESNMLEHLRLERGLFSAGKIVSRHSKATLEVCSRAPYGEVSEAVDGTLTIGFVKGEEPDSTRYEVDFGPSTTTGSKPASVRARQTPEPSNNLDIGRATMDHGTARPQEVLDEVKKLCGTNSYDTGGGTVHTKVSDKRSSKSEQLQIKPDGHFNDEETRLNFVEALKGHGGAGAKMGDQVPSPSQSSATRLSPARRVHPKHLFQRQPN